MSRPPSGPFRGRFWFAYGGAVAAGVVLRLYRLRPQVLLGDEVHAVRAVASRPWPEILWTYGTTDVCLPLAGLARWLSERGVVLSEAAFRVPVVVSGLLLLALFPWLVRRVAAPAAALLFPWWLALSPQLVLYGRIARSYTPSTLLAGLAAAAFFAWWRTRRRGFALAYAVLGALAVWFHLLVAVFVAAPLGFAGLAKIRAAVARRIQERRETVEGESSPPEARDLGPRPSWPALLATGSALAGGLALFLVPGRESLVAVLTAKPGRGEIRLDTVVGAAKLLAGSAEPGLAAVFWLAAVGGLWMLARRDRELALYSAVLALAHVAVLLHLQPYGIANPLVFGRYLLVLVPLLLLWVAHGFAWGAASGRWWPRVAGLGAGALLLALLLATGPFATERFHTSSFVHHEDFLAFHRPLPTLSAEHVPAFYRRLAERPGPAALVEMPAYPEGQNRVLHQYQDLHRRQVILATTDPALNDPRFDFHNRVRPDPEVVLTTRASHLVVHRDLEAEELSVELPPGVPRLWQARQRNLGEHFRRTAEAYPARVRAAFGPPHRVSARLLIWNLDRIRSRRELAGGALSLLDAATGSPILQDLPAPDPGAGRVRSGRGPRPRPVRLADLPLVVATGDREGAPRDTSGGGGHRRPDRGSGGGAG